jgi:uncharacterized protein (TIGR00251 family)
MMFHVKVIPNAKMNEVSQEGQDLRVRLNARPSKGRANKALTELLAEHFNVRKGAVKIVKGEKSREKVVEVDLEDVG